MIEFLPLTHSHYKGHRNILWSFRWCFDKVDHMKLLTPAPHFFLCYFTVTSCNIILKSKSCARELIIELKNIRYALNSPYCRLQWMENARLQYQRIWEILHATVSSFWSYYDRLSHKSTSKYRSHGRTVCEELIEKYIEQIKSVLFAKSGANKYTILANFFTSETFLSSCIPTLVISMQTKHHARQKDKQNRLEKYD